MIGEILDRKYKLVSLLGQGGMGAVYEAQCEGTGANVAVKVLHGHLAEGDGARRFQREAEAARRIKSNNIVRIVEAGTCTTSGRMFLVTELLEGNDLQHWIDRIGPLSLHGVVRMAAQALRGLCDAHGARVVHRDIKPANLFLARGPNGTLTVKILDFGIAKVHREPFSQGTTTDVTATGSMVGSPLYMSPEQIQDSRNVDARTDVWALGSVLYAALSGRAPHQHLSSMGQLLVAICVHPAKPLVEVAPWVPAQIAAIVHRALEIDAAARYPSATAMLADIEKLVPAGELREEDLLSSRDGFRSVYLSSLPPSAPAEVSRVVVGPSSDKPIRGDEATVVVPRHEALSETEMQPRVIERSAVPKLGTHVAGKHVTVDPRRFLGEKSELWTLSLDVHRDISTLLSRIWKAMRRAGAKVPPMSYGTEWVLYEPRTQKFVADTGRDGGKMSLEEAGIRSGAVLWIMMPEGKKDA
ncbi:MAG: serine/threonine protein kinase [Polyangiaceae bacterium]|nr:serine/threonine protein kinase [Polyangiaceae bacterium]